MFSTAMIVWLRRSLLPAPEHVQSGGSPGAAAGRGVDSPTITEFKQVKLHAQNQIILLKVLSEEREQVLCALTPSKHFIPFRNKELIKFFFLLTVCLDL